MNVIFLNVTCTESLVIMNMLDLYSPFNIISSGFPFPIKVIFLEMFTLLIEYSPGFIIIFSLALALIIFSFNSKPLS